MLTTSQQKLVINTLAIVGAIHTVKVVRANLALSTSKLNRKK